jgi:uncharacterized membrane protein YjjB (DUF3815 family)
MLYGVCFAVGAKIIVAIDGCYGSAIGCPILMVFGCTFESCVIASIIVGALGHTHAFAMKYKSQKRSVPMMQTTPRKMPLNIGPKS